MANINLPKEGDFPWDLNPAITAINAEAEATTNLVTTGRLSEDHISSEIAGVVNTVAIPSAQKGANNGVASLDGSGDVPYEQLPPALAPAPLLNTFVTPGQKDSDPTVGGKKVQKLTANMWLQGLNILGNNTGLAPDPRQPLQVNNVIDGSTLTNTTYLGNKVAFVNNGVFKGGFTAEAGWGALDPAALFGIVNFMKTGGSAGDLDGINAFYAQTSEAHLYTPGATLGTFIGLETVANVEASAVGATVTNAYGIFARVPVDNVGGVIQNAYGVYIEAPPTASGWSLRAKGLAQFDGRTMFTGTTPSTSGAAVAPGAYLGRDTGSGSTLELSNGTTNIQVANSLANQLEVRLAGTRVMMSVTTGGQLNLDGSGSFGRGSQASLPGTQAATKGAYIGRSAGGTVGIELGDGTNSFRVVNTGSNEIAFERTGITQLGKFNSSGDFFITKGLSFAPTTQTTAPSAGAGAALPATPAGYADITINGTLRKIAYY